MPKLPSVGPKKVIRAFERLGWEIRRQTGSHVVMKKEGNPWPVSIPYHARDVKPGLLKGQLKGAGIDEDDFLDAL